MDYWLQFLGVAVAVALADICWTYYFIKVEERKAIMAGVWSSLLIILGAFSIENYVHDKTLIIAAALGAFIGTAGSIYFKKRKEDGKQKVE